jgi:hypothetical protein
MKEQKKKKTNKKRCCRLEKKICKNQQNMSRILAGTNKIAKKVVFFVENKTINQLNLLSAKVSKKQKNVVYILYLNHSLILQHQHNPKS